MKKRFAVLLLMILSCLALVLFGACGGGNDDQGDNPPDTDVVDPDPDPDPDPVPGPDDEGDCATLGHNYTLDVSQSKDASCKEEGLIVKVCTRCGDVQKTPVEKLAHTYVADAEKSKAPSCKEEGVNAFKCSECGDNYTEPVKKLDHIFEPDETLSKDATCTVAGKRVLKCAECGETSETPIPALGHSFTGFACEDRTCSVCGAKTPATVQHSYVLSGTEEEPLDSEDAEVYCNGATYNVYQCEVCGAEKMEKKSDAVLHVVTDWEQEGELTLTDSANCDYERTLKGQCTLCGEEIIHTQLVEGNHKYQTVIDTRATCTTEGERHQECTVCHTTKPDSTETYSDPDAHLWNDGTKAGNVTTFACTRSGCNHTKTSIVADGNTLTASKSDIKDVSEVSVGGASVMMDDAAKGNLPDENLTLDFNSAQDVPDQDLGDKLEGKKLYSITMTKESGGLFTDFGSGEVTVRIPYTLEEGQDPTSIEIWYVDGNELKAMKATYSEGYAVFKTNHFSYYTVGVMTPEEMCVRYGHAEATFDRKATCLTNGYHTKICTRCGEVYEDEIIPALGHKWEKDDENSEAATCTAAGQTVYKCTNENCNRTRTETIPALGHAWKKDASSVAATCTTAGKDVYTCEHGCGQKLEAEVPMAPHDCTEVVTKPTCTAGGYTTFTCKNCHIVYTGAETAPTGHIWDIEEPTCTEGQTCTVCGAKGQQATGHTWDIEEPTCTKGQTCTVCGAEGKPKLPHTYGEEGYCTVCGDGCDHKFTVLEDVASTCTVAGHTTSKCSVCNQIKTETKELLAHNFDEQSGRCTVCGAVDPARSSEYFEVLKSLKADCYTVDLSGISFREESETFVVTATVDEGEARFTFKDGRPVFLISITRISETTMSTGHDEGQDLSDILEYCDGYTMVVQYTMKGETYYQRMPMASGSGEMVYSELSFLTQLAQDEEIGAYVEKLFYGNYMVLSSLLDKAVNTVFTRKDDAKGYTLSLNRKALVDLSEMLMKNTVREIVEKVIGEGNFDKLVAYVKEMMTEKTAKEAIDDLLTRAQEYHIEKDELFAFVNHVADLLSEEIGKIQSSMGGSMGGGSASGNVQPDVGYNEPAVHAEGGESQPEQPKFDIEALYNDENLSKATLAEVMGLGSEALTQMIDGYVNAYAGVKPYELIKKSSGGRVTGEMIHDIVETVCEGDAIDISLRVEGGKVKTILFNLNNVEVLNIAEMGVNIHINGSVAVELGEGKVELPEGGRDSKLIDAVKRRIQQNGGSYTLRIKNGTRYGGTTVVFTLSGDKVGAVITVDSIENYNIYNGTRSIFTIEDLAAAELQVRKACGDGVYAFTYAAEWQRSARIKVDFDTDGSYTIKETSALGNYYYSSRFTVALNEVTGTFEDDYVHKFAVDEKLSQSPDSVKCEEYYKVVEVCSKCGETREYYERKNHDINRRYILVNKNGDCEDGVYSESYCTVCNRVIYTDSENIRYEHEMYSTSETVKTDDGEFLIEYETCACGREKRLLSENSGYGDTSAKRIYHIHDGKAYAFLRDRSVGTLTTYTCSKYGCDGTLTVEETTAVEEECYYRITSTVTISGQKHVYKYTYRENHPGHEDEAQSQYKEYSLAKDGYDGSYRMTTYLYDCDHKDDYVVIEEVHLDQYGRTIYSLRERYNLDNDNNSSYYECEYRYEGDSCRYAYYVSHEKGKAPEYDYSGTRHASTETEYRLLGTTCEDGVEITETCSLCHEVVYTDTIYDHQVMESRDTITKANGELVAIVYTAACPCGAEMYEVRIESRGSCEIDIWHGEEPEHGPNGHDIYEYRCGVTGCNITVKEECWEVYENCEHGTYSIFTFYEGDTLIGKAEGYKGYSYHGTEHDVTETEVGREELTADELGTEHADAYGTRRVIHSDYHCDHYPDCTETVTEMYDKFGRIYYRLERTVLDADGSVSEYYEERRTFTDTTCEGYREWRNGEDEEWRSEPLSDSHTYGASQWVENTCTQYGYRVETCRICGEQRIYDIWRPIGHDYRDGRCEICGLETPQEADAEITLEDMSTEENYVIGAWANPNATFGDFTYQTFFVFLDKEGIEHESPCDVNAWVESYRLPEQRDSRIYTLAKSTLESAMNAAIESAEEGWEYVGVEFLLTARFNNTPHVIRFVLTEKSIYDDNGQSSSDYDIPEMKPSDDDKSEWAI